MYTHIKGVISDLLKDHLDDNPQDYDLALINHNSCAHVSARRKVYTCHGILPGLETPPHGMDTYIAVSENVAELYGIERIIKNPIDTELFRPLDPINHAPHRILAVTEVPVPFDCTRPTRAEETMPQLMQQADVVITIGRGVLEAMSTARNVIVYDKRPDLGFKADGYLTLPIRGNVGGPYLRKDIDLHAELKKYRQEHGERNREYILQHHDVKDIVSQYLNLI